MAKQVTLKKLVNQTMETIYPETSASVVYSASGNTVQYDLTNLTNRVTTLETNYTNLVDQLGINAIYMTSNSQVMTDGEGSNLVAVY